MKRKKYEIPLDTLGHPLPPPVPSDTICRIPKSRWAGWWHRFYNNKLPEDRDCCVCGFTFEMKLLTPLNAKLLVDPGIQRQYLNSMMLPKIFLCAGCRKKCESCSQYIPNAQRTHFENLCQECYTSTNTSKKRKTPSRS